MGEPLEDRVAWGMASALALVGTVLIALYPAARYYVNRERRDIERAAAEIFSTPFETLPTATERTFEVRVPDDEQWRRIESRLNAPTLVLMAVSRNERRSGYPRTVPGLRARVSENDNELAVTPIHAILHSGEGDGLELHATRGSRLTLPMPISRCRARSSSLRRTGAHRFSGPGAKALLLARS